MSDYSNTWAEVDGVDDVDSADFNTQFVAIETAVATKTELIDEDDMSSDLDTKCPSQQSVKAYVKPLTSETVTATTSGTTADYTSIPSWAKKITIMLQGVSFNAADYLGIRIGDSGGIENTGYVSYAYAKNLSLGETIASDADNATLFMILASIEAAAGSSISGTAELVLIDSSTNTWLFRGSFIDTDPGGSAGTREISFTTGYKSLSGTLDRVQLTTTAPRTFDAGKFNILYEG